MAEKPQDTIARVSAVLKRMDGMPVRAPDGHEGALVTADLAAQIDAATAPKSWAASKTVWLNLVGLLLALLAPNVDQIAAVLPEDWAEIVLVLLPVANLVLRKLTHRPITAPGAAGG